MKNATKLTAAGLVIALIGAIVMTVGACLGGASPTIKYEDAVYEQQTAKITAVELSLAAGEVETEFYGGDRIVIEYPETDYLYTDISEKDGALKLDSGMRRWSFFNYYDIPPVVVKLPEGNVYDLKISLSAGTLEVGDGVYGNLNVEMSAGTAEFGDVECGNFRLKTSAGTAEFDKLKCGAAEFKISAGTVNPERLVCPRVSVSLSAGKFECGIVGKEEDYSISADVSAGSCNLSPRTGNGAGKSLEIEVSAGAVEIEFVRA